MRVAFACRSLALVLPVTAAMIVCVTALPGRADAQIRDIRRAGEPAVWLSAGIGFAQFDRIDDGRTNSTWDFSDGAEYRASLEVALAQSVIGRGTTLGVTGSWTHMPLAYYENAGLSSTNTGPTVRHDAHADISTLMAQVRAGGGAGLHQVIEIGAGVLRFNNFTDDGSKQPLPPTSDTDFTFAIAYGVGYTMSRSTQIALVQEYGLSIHQRDQLPNDARSSLRRLTTRLSIRAGLGGGR